MATFLCRIKDRESEWRVWGLHLVVPIEAESFEDAASKLFPGMELGEPLFNDDNTRLVNARNLPANEIGITHRYSTSGYMCTRSAWITRMPSGWSIDAPPKVKREIRLVQMTMEAWA